MQGIPPIVTNRGLFQGERAGHLFLRWSNGGSRLAAISSSSDRAFTAPLLHLLSTAANRFFDARRSLGPSQTRVGACARSRKQTSWNRPTALAQSTAQSAVRMTKAGDQRARA
jgi:hypothetical protein